MEIHRERFEAWLFSQPVEREFVYNQPTECAFCCFIRETTSKFSRCSTNYGIYNLQSDAHRLSGCDEPPRFPFPAWMQDNATLTGILMVRPLTIGNMQRRYLQIFPDFSPTSDVNHESEAKGGALSPVPLCDGPRTTIHGTAQPSLETREGEEI